MGENRARIFKFNYITVMEERINQIFLENRELLAKIDVSSRIAEAAEMLVECFRNGGKVLICGNGGSMAEAEHFSGELVARFRRERRGLPAITLGSNAAVLSAWSNDYDYRTALAREVEALGNSGDVLIVMSTSGNSANVIEAVKMAKHRSMKVIGFLGEGGALREMADVVLAVPSGNTPRIQEIHLIMVHIISELIEEKI